MQYAYLPLHFIGITQGCNGQYSHRGLNAIDFGWSATDSTSFNLYAPFDCKVVALYGNTNVLAVESLEKVKWADGTEDYMTIITCHDNNPPKLNTIFKQGEIYSHLGTKGGVGKHCHLEVQKGKYQKYTAIKQTGATANIKSLIFPNTIEPYKVLYVVDNVTYSTKAGYNPYTWKKVEKEETDYKGLYESEKEKSAKLQAKLDAVKGIVND